VCGSTRGQRHHRQSRTQQGHEGHEEQRPTAEAEPPAQQRLQPTGRVTFPQPANRRASTRDPAAEHPFGPGILCGKADLLRGSTSDEIVTQRSPEPVDGRLRPADGLGAPTQPHRPGLGPGEQEMLDLAPGTGRRASGRHRTPPFQVAEDRRDRHDGIDVVEHRPDDLREPAVHQGERLGPPATGLGQRPELSQPGQDRAPAGVEENAREADGRMDQADGLQLRQCGRDRRQDRDRLPGKQVAAALQKAAQRPARELFQYEAGAAIGQGADIDERGQPSDRQGGQGLDLPFDREVIRSRMEDLEHDGRRGATLLPPPRLIPGRGRRGRRHAHIQVGPVG